MTQLHCSRQVSVFRAGFSLLAAPVFLLLELVGCNTSAVVMDSGRVPSDVPTITDTPSDAPNPNMTVTSTAFTMSMPIPPKHAYTGCGVSAMNLSPQLTWAGAPANTQSFAIIFDDIDVPPPDPFTHWIAWNIPSTTTSLDEGVMSNTNEFINGRNDFPLRGYAGPCAPRPERHRYVFTVYALDVASIPLLATASAGNLKLELEGHILARGQLTGTYRQ